MLDDNSHRPLPDSAAPTRGPADLNLKLGLLQMTVFRRPYNVKGYELRAWIAWNVGPANRVRDADAGTHVDTRDSDVVIMRPTQTSRA